MSIQVIPVSWDEAQGTTPRAFSRRIRWARGALSVWWLHPALAGRASLQFGDAPQPLDDEASGAVPIRAGDEFTHRAGFVQLNIADPPPTTRPGMPGSVLGHLAPFAVLILADSACELPVRTLPRGGPILPWVYTGAPITGQLGELAGAIELHYLQASFFGASTPATDYVRVYLTTGSGDRWAELFVVDRSTERLVLQEPLVLTGAPGFATIEVSMEYSGGAPGPGTETIVHLGWRPIEGV